MCVCVCKYMALKVFHIEFAVIIFIMVGKLVCNLPESDNNARRDFFSKFHWSSGRGCPRNYLESLTPCLNHF